MANINFTPLQPTATAKPSGGINFTPLNKPAPAPTPPQPSVNDKINNFLSTPAYSMGPENQSGVVGTLGKEAANIGKSGLKFGYGFLSSLNPFQALQVPSTYGNFIKDFTAAGKSIAQGNQLAAKAQALPSRPGHAFAGLNAEQIQAPPPPIPDFTIGGMTSTAVEPQINTKAVQELNPLNQEHLGQVHIANSLQSLAEDPFQLAPALLGLKGALEMPTGEMGVSEATGAPQPATFADTKVGGAIEKGISTIAKPGVAAIDLAGKAVGKVGDLANTLAKYGTAQATGFSPKTISTILQNPEKFLGDYKSNFTREALGEKVSTAIDQRLENLSATGKEYQAIRTSGEKVQVPPATLQNILDQFNIKLDKNGQIKTNSETLPMSSGDQVALQKFIDTFGKKTELTANGFLNARKTLDNMAKWDASKTSASTTLSRVIRTAYDILGKDQITGLRELDAKYSPEVNLLKQIKKDYLKPDGTFKDNAVSKLANLTNKGKESALARLEQITPGISKEINVLRAVEDIANAGGQKVGTYTRAALTGATYLSSGLPGAVVEAILTHPAVATKILAGWGKLQGVDISGLLNKVFNTEVKPNVGLTIKDVSGEAPPKEQGAIPPTTNEPKPLSEDYQVGLSNVAGKGYEPGKPQMQSDTLMEQAKSLYAEGKTQEAQAKYQEAVDFGIRKTQEAFQGTGIKIKVKAGYGVFEGNIEPNIDFSATVPKGKEDLFHTKLAQLADQNFNQKSFITYRNAPNDNLGWVDQSKGLSQEPLMRITFKEPIGLDKTAQIDKLMKDNGLPGGSFKDNGKTLDILNLSHYNTDYVGFIQKLNSFETALDRQGILGDVRKGTAEVRHIGTDTANGPATYGGVQRAFYGENPGLKPKGTKALQGVTSKVLDRLPFKETVGKQEISQMLNSPDISAAEKQTVQNLLAQQGDKISTSDFAYKLRQSLLKTSPEASQSYASYGLDNLGEIGNSAKAETTLLRTGVDTGVSGHFGVGDELGHIRTFTEFNGKPKEVFVSEIQSDPFQRGLNIQSLADLVKESEDKKANLLNRIDELKAENVKFQEQLKNPSPEDVGNSYNADTLKRDIAWNTEQIAKMQQTLINDLPKLADLKDQLASGKKFVNPADQKVADLQDTINNLKDSIFSEDKAKVLRAKDQLAAAEAEQAKFNTPGQQAKTEQMMNLAKDNKYRQVLLNEALVNLRDKGYKEINLPTPSTVAKIEWGKGVEDSEDTMPYEVVNASDPQDLSHGDTIDYGGIEYTVVDRSVGSITVAPSEHVNSFKWNDFVDEEIQNNFSNAQDEISKQLEKGITPAQAQKMADKGDMNWETTKLLEAIADQPDKISTKNLSQVEDAVKEKFANQIDFSLLQDIYGRGNVFSHEIGRGYDSQIYTVDEGHGTENFGQPTEYNTPYDYNPTAIDNNKAEAQKIFSKSEMGVLDNYYEMQKNLAKIQKQTDIAITPFEDNSGNTWIKVKPNKNLKKTPF